MTLLNDVKKKKKLLHFQPTLYLVEAERSLT